MEIFKILTETKVDTECNGQRVKLNERKQPLHYTLTPKPQCSPRAASSTFSSFK